MDYNNTKSPNALQGITTGSRNTAFGTGAGQRLTTGSLNIILGYNVGTFLTTGSSNILIGNGTDSGSNLVEPPTATTSNWLNIGNCLYGNLSTQSMAISSTMPTAITAAKLMVGGSIGTKIATLTANTTLTILNSTALVDATSGAITITLPTAASMFDTVTGIGSTFVVKKIDSSANNVSVVVSGGATIDGIATQVLSTQYSSITVQSNGTSYFIL